MRFSIALGVFVAIILGASQAIADVNIESVDYIVARDFEELELRRGGGATGGGHGAAAAAAASKNRPLKSKPKDQKKRRSKKAKGPKGCENGNGPIESRALDELVERRGFGLLGRLANHLRCPGEEHHAREVLELFMERQLEAEEADAYEARDFDDFDGNETRDVWDNGGALEG